MRSLNYKILLYFTAIADILIIRILLRLPPKSSFSLEKLLFYFLFVDALSQTQRLVSTKGKQAFLSISFSIGPALPGRKSFSVSAYRQTGPDALRCPYPLRALYPRQTSDAGPADQPRTQRHCPAPGKSAAYPRCSPPLRGSALPAAAR